MRRLSHRRTHRRSLASAALPRSGGVAAHAPARRKPRVDDHGLGTTKNRRR